MKLAEAEPLGPGEPRTHGSGSPEGTGSGEGVALPGSEVEPLSSGRDGSPGLPGHPSPGEMAAEKEPAQETTAFLDLGGEPPSPPKEMRGSGALGGPCACSPVSCTMSRTSIHSSLGTLSIRSNPLNLFVTSIV